MKILPIATNHIQIQLENGEWVDVNDGTLARGGGHLLLEDVGLKSNWFIKRKDLGTIAIEYPIK